jgi:CcmD family protein
MQPQGKRDRSEGLTKEFIMGTFVAAYLVIWLAVAVYVALLGLRQRRLARQIERLQADVAQRECGEEAAAKAA